MRYTDALTAVRFAALMATRESRPYAVCDAWLGFLVLPKAKAKGRKILEICNP